MTELCSSPQNLPFFTDDGHNGEICQKQWNSNSKISPICSFEYGDHTTYGRSNANRKYSFSNKPYRNSISIWRFLRLSDQVSTQTQDKILQETAELLGEQAGETYDELARDVMVTGTNVLYGGVATSRGTVQAGENITTTLLDKAINILDNGNARKITKMVTPDPGYESRPINSCYVGIVHPNVAYTLQGLTGFIPVEKYANKADVMDNEIGSYKKFVS